MNRSQTSTPSAHISQHERALDLVLICMRLILATVAVSFATVASAERLIGNPKIIDGDTLAIGDVIVRIAGIDAPESDQSCIRDNGHKWNCGKAAGTELQQAIGDQTISCSGTQQDRYGRLLAVCRLGRVDIGAYLVKRGLALAYVRYEDTYIEQELSARESKRGIWSGSFEQPEQHRQKKWQEAARQAASGGCPIKGNINSDGVRIYHVPWSSAYKKTRVNPDKGERWFCSEQEASDAGWRPPRRHK